MTDLQLRQFLLRRTDAGLTARLEDAILIEDGFAERLREAELDLLDDYAASRLNAEDVGSVERYLLKSVENQHTVRIARALLQEAGTPGTHALGTPPSHVAWRPRAGKRPRWSAQRVSGMALLAAASVAALVFVPRWLLNPERPEAGAIPGAPVRGASATSSRLSLPVTELPVVTLLADVSRGAERPAIEVRADAASLRLQLEVPGQPRESSYSIEIRDPGGRTLFEERGLAVQTAGPYRFVEAVLPSPALAPGNRTVMLIPAAGDNPPPVFSWHVAAALKPPPPK